MWSDRVTPITSIARVYSYLVRVAPEVSGNIVEVKIKNNQVVRVGDVMFRVDARNYDLAVRSAQAKLELAGQNIGASTTAVEVAQAKVTDALAARVSELATKGVLSKSELDNAIEARSRAQAALNAAEASLQQAKQNLGPKGNNNPQILAAMVSLEKAQLDL
nr:biotin/lipoyl-binding protein [Vibrio fluvialis]